MGLNISGHQRDRCGGQGELVAAGQARIVVPTVYRNNYLAALRGMSVNGHADGLIAALAFAQRWTAQIDWSSVEQARADLERTHATLDSTDAEAEGLRRQLPAAAAP